MGDSTVWHFVTAAFSSWYDVKMVIERAATITSDAMHVIAGVLLQLLAALITRRPLSSWKPWLVVLVLLLFNEAVDLWAERWPIVAMQLGEGVKDIILTLFLPTILLLAFRLSPALSRSGRR